jgi:hypothetical protein
MIGQCTLIVWKEWTRKLQYINTPLLLETMVSNPVEFALTIEVLIRLRVQHVP